MPKAAIEMDCVVCDLDSTANKIIVEINKKDLIPLKYQEVDRLFSFKLSELNDTF